MLIVGVAEHATVYAIHLACGNFVSHKDAVAIHLIWAKFVARQAPWFVEASRTVLALRDASVL